MKNLRMEIKVALLGNVSAGKTTVLNAILQNKYGEVAKKRTTAGANYFYLNVVKDVAKGDTEEDLRLAEAIHQEIVVDNWIKVRDGQEVSKKEFEIEIPEPIVRCRQDTVIVLVDIPGINEAGTENKYKEFVSDHWTTFDCVILVMDGKQGVNTEDQVFLLKIVKEHQQKKNIPVIILCNKVDDPLEEEQVELVQEARKEVQKIFGVQCRKRSLETLLSSNKKQKVFEPNMSPSFISMSAGNAFIYRCGHQMTLNQFKSFDKAIIDGFGRSQFGQKTWNGLSAEKRIEKVFAMVKDHAQYDEGMKECNFDTFMKILDMFVGGEDRQTHLIGRQIEVSLGSGAEEPFTAGQITQAIRSAYLNLVRLGTFESFGGANELQSYFWETFETFEDSSFEKFEASWPVPKVEVLAGLTTELNLYADLVSELKWDSEKPRIISNGKLLVHRYFKFLLEKNSDMDKDRKSVDLCSSITPMDWFLILESILLLSCNQRFCEAFGRIKTEFSFRLLIASKMMGKMRESLESCPSCNRTLTKHDKGYGIGVACKFCCVMYVAVFPQHCVIHGPGYGFYGSTDRFNCCWNHYVYQLHENVEAELSCLKQKYGPDDDLVPYKPDVFQKFVHIRIPQSLEDPNHFGHVPFKFCKLMERLM